MACQTRFTSTAMSDDTIVRGTLRESRACRSSVEVRLDGWIIAIRSIVTDQTVTVAVGSTYSTSVDRRVCRKTERAGRASNVAIAVVSLLRSQARLVVVVSMCMITKSIALVVILIAIVISPAHSEDTVVVTVGNPVVVEIVTLLMTLSQIMNAAMLVVVAESVVVRGGRGTDDLSVRGHNV